MGTEVHWHGHCTAGSNACVRRPLAWMHAVHLLNRDSTAILFQAEVLSLSLRHPASMIALVHSQAVAGCEGQLAVSWHVALPVRTDVHSYARGCRRLPTQRPQIQPSHMHAYVRPCPVSLPCLHQRQEGPDSHLGHRSVSRPTRSLQLQQADAGHGWLCQWW